MMGTLYVFLLLCHFAFAVKHSLIYVLTATSGVPNFPEFAAAAMVDGIQVGHCDSELKTAEPKLDWMKKLVEDEPHHLQWYVRKCSGNQQVFRAIMDSLKQLLNQTEGHHVLQRMNGCDWDNETGVVTGFNQYGFDGEDFIALDLKTLTWTAPKPQAVFTKLRWDAEKARLEYNKQYYIHKCPDWLKKYVDYGKSFLLRTVLPSVSLLQKSPSSPISCFATGFYPNRADMFWRRDGEQTHEDVDHGEILPNPDGTFQMRVHLDLSSVTAQDWSRYECVFQLSGMKDDVITKLDRAEIRTNEVPPSSLVRAVVIGAVVLLLTVGIAGIFMWRRRRQAAAY
ncbi:major histocompatibility complex class I-related gene protein-like isoform X2 [Betta splendens]|uniref:Major histocompatibility complex class I-related gene protein-like isoform X2 n=1 Tax=Betta splendens TaxID=158456 RepID=A0A8M1HKV6_BETSP|nr:major histocompatibility complex class I-related gene protein-like isoform X2 [Betta splendens]XP_040928823.1 major histocompatibility complex class I-related gene protein-like isoform X2 [Betta splendens]